MVVGPPTEEGSNPSVPEPIAACLYDEDMTVPHAKYLR
jgi:hypothetical protein